MISYFERFLRRQRIGRVARKALKRKQTAMEHSFDSGVISYFERLLRRQPYPCLRLVCSETPPACCICPRWIRTCDSSGEEAFNKSGRSLLGGLIWEPLLLSRIKPDLQKRFVGFFSDTAWVQKNAVCVLREGSSNALTSASNALVFLAVPHSDDPGRAAPIHVGAATERSARFSSRPCFR